MFTDSSNQTTEIDRIETLRLILERQQSKVISVDEAREIGESLITFFEVLGENVAGSEHE